MASKYSYEPERPVGGRLQNRSTSGSEAFDKLNFVLTDDAALRGDVESALMVLLERLNPSDAGVRWAVGTVVEWTIAGALYAAGALSIPEGHKAAGIDLQDLLGQLRATFSVKSSFSPKVGTFRLTNGMGGGGLGFAEPTLFLHPRLPGIVYADPELHPTLARDVRSTADATTISVTAVRSHAQEHPECVIPLKIPANGGRGRADPGTSFARDLLVSGRFPRLERLFNDVAAAAQPKTILDEIMELKELRREGDLDEAQFRLAVAKLLQLPPRADQAAPGRRTVGRRPRR